MIQDIEIQLDTEKAMITVVLDSVASQPTKRFYLCGTEAYDDSSNSGCCWPELNVIKLFFLGEIPKI